MMAQMITPQKVAVVKVFRAFMIGVPLFGAGLLTPPMRSTAGLPV
jgi:hypothetical protein